MRPTASRIAALAFGFGCASAASAWADIQTPVRATQVAPDKARPAESGARDSAATVGPLAIGAEVRDATGAEVGRVVLLTTDKDGRSVAKVRLDEDIFMIPVSDLRSRRGGVISSVSLEALKRGGDGIAASPAR